MERNKNKCKKMNPNSIAGSAKAMRSKTEERRKQADMALKKASSAEEGPTIFTLIGLVCERFENCELALALTMRIIFKSHPLALAIDQCIGSRATRLDLYEVALSQIPNQSEQHRRATVMLSEQRRLGRIRDEVAHSVLSETQKEQTTKRTLQAHHGRKSHEGGSAFHHGPEELRQFVDDILTQLDGWLEIQRLCVNIE